MKLKTKTAMLVTASVAAGLVFVSGLGPVSAATIVGSDGPQLAVGVTSAEKAQITSAAHSYGLSSTEIQAVLADKTAADNFPVRHDVTVTAVPSAMTPAARAATTASEKAYRAGQTWTLATSSSGAVSSVQTAPTDPTASNRASMTTSSDSSSATVTPQTSDVITPQAFSSINVGQTVTPAMAPQMRVNATQGPFGPGCYTATASYNYYAPWGRSMSYNMSKYYCWNTFGLISYAPDPNIWGSVTRIASVSGWSYSGTISTNNFLGYQDVGGFDDAVSFAQGHFTGCAAHVGCIYNLYPKNQIDGFAEGRYYVNH